MIHVFLVDDHPVVRCGLRTMIESSGDLTVIEVASCAEEALRSAALARADLVLTDLRMPGMDGLQFIAHLRQARVKARVAVFTNFHSDEDVFRAFDAGATAYLMKSDPDEEIFAVIRRAHAGECCVPEGIARQLVERNGRIQLSARELQILDHVAHGLTNREIGEILNISDKTVRNHVVSCLDKLRAKDRTEATAIALRRGLIAEPDAL